MPCEKIPQVIINIRTSFRSSVFWSVRKKILYPDHCKQYNLHKPQIFPWVRIRLKQNLTSFDLTYKRILMSTHFIWTHRNAFNSIYAHPSPYMNTSMNSNTHRHGLTHTYTHTYKHTYTQTEPYIKTYANLNTHAHGITYTQIYVQNQEHYVPNLFLYFQHVKSILHISVKPNPNFTHIRKP